MAVNPFEQFGFGGGANMGGYGFGGGGGMTTPNLGGQQGTTMPQRGGQRTGDMTSPGFTPGVSASPIQNTSNPIVRSGGARPTGGDIGTAPPWAQQGYQGWRNQMTGFGGSPFTYTQPQNPWMQQGGPWGMANRGANPYFGQNTADPRFQNNFPGVGNPFGQSNSPFSWMQQGGGVNPMWQALQQQRFIQSQNPYAPMQPNPQQNFWLPGMNPYANQQPSTGQGMQGPSQWQGLQQRYASDNRRKPDFI